MDPTCVKARQLARSLPLNNPLDELRHTMNMKSIFEKLYFFAVICANVTVIAAVFGGHAALNAGDSGSALSSGSSDPVLLAINIAIGLSTVVLAFPRTRQIIYMLSRHKLLLALYMLVALSILWSSDRASTFRIGAYLFLYLIAAVYIALRFDDEEIIDLLAKSMVILGLLSVPGNFLLPPDPYQPDSWKGVFLHKNELGMAMAIGITALVASRKRWSLVRMMSILVCSGLLYLSQSMTSIIAVAITVVVIMYLRLKRHLSVVFLTSVIGSALMLLTAAPDLQGIFSSATSRDLTLTGRTAIWALVTEKIREKPILGYGYGAFWSTEAESVNQFLEGFKPGQAHNGYLEICLDLGMLGLALCVSLIAAVAIRALRLNRHYHGRCGDWPLIVIVLLLIHSLTESDLMRNNIMWALFIVACVSSMKARDGCRTAMITEGLQSCEREPVAA